MKKLMGKIIAIPDQATRIDLWNFFNEHDEKENETKDETPETGKKHYCPAQGGYQNGQYMLNKKTGVYVQFTNVFAKKNTVKYAGWRMIPGAIPLDTDQAARMRNITSFTAHASALKHGKEATSNLREWIRCDCNGNILPGEKNYFWTMRAAGCPLKG